MIAPIARYNSVWGIPILTTGGLTDAFSIKPNYPTLTRMMGSYSDTGLAVREIRRHFNWTVQAFIYHDNDENKGKGHSDCSMAISSIFRALNTTDYFSHNFDETESSYKDYLQFLTKTKRKARSKWNQSSVSLLGKVLFVAQTLVYDHSGWRRKTIDFSINNTECQKG